MSCLFACSDVSSYQRRTLEIGDVSDADKNNSFLRELFYFANWGRYMLGMIGSSESLPEEQRTTLTALAHFHKTRVLSGLPSPQRLASLHRFLVRRFIDDTTFSLTQEQYELVDSGAYSSASSLSSVQRSDVCAALTLTEWIEDTRAAFEEGKEDYAVSHVTKAIASSEARLNALGGRIRTMLPLLFTTLGSVTSDGGLFIMPKNRADMLAGYFLESLDETARATMRFLEQEPPAEEPSEDEENRKKKKERKLESFPKLMEGIRRLKTIAKDEDGSDLVVDRLLSSIDMLFLESLTAYAYKKSALEVVRRKKKLRQEVNDTPFSPEQALLEIMKQHLERIYAVQERACKAFSEENAPEKSGYTPFLLPDSVEYLDILDEEEIQREKKKKAGDLSFERAFLEILSADRGLFTLPRIRSRGLPGILFLPGNAVGAYDKKADFFLLPFSALRERAFEHLLNAFASFRWAWDDSGKVLNLCADLVGSRGAKPQLELEAAFRRAYSSWLQSEIRGRAVDEHGESIKKALRPEGNFARFGE